MIFDFISGEASTQEGGEKFAKWLAEDADLTQKEKKSVVEKIKDFFTKLLDAVRSVIEGQGTLNATARAGQKAAQQVPVLDDFFNALDNAIDNRQRMLDGDTAQKNSTGEKTGADVRFSIDPNFEKVYDQWDGSDPRVTFFLGTTGRALKKAGMVNQKIYFDASKILKIKNKHPEITDRVIKQIPSVLQNPIVIMKSKDPKNKPRNFKGYTIFGELYVRNNPVLVVLGADMYGRNGMKLDGVKVVSAYRRNNAQSFMDSSDVVFVTKNKERISMWEGRTGLRLPVGDSSTNSPDTTIPQTGSSVNTHSMQNGQKNAQNGKNNTRHSLEVDREYQRAGEEQKAKIIEQQAKEWGAYTDADGKPVKLYHGTSQFGFTEFDLNKMDDGRSIFMTSDPVIASTYSGVEGGKKISERNQVDVDTVSNKELATLLNQHAQEPTVDYDYFVMDMQGRNDLITHVNGELEWLKGEVDREIEQFNGDGETVRKLQDLKNALDKNSYDQLSTKIYMLLHHGDTFRNSAEQSQRISQAEQDVRLLNQVRQLDHAEPMIVEKALGGYSIDLLSVEEAKNRLKQCINKGNYSLYAKLENPLVVDAFGDYWNGLDYRVPQDRYEVRNQYGAYQVFDRNTMQPAWIDGKMNWNTAAEAQQALGTLTDNKMDKRLTTTRDIAEYAKASGYDGVVFKRIKDSGGENVKVPSDREADVYVAFNPNAVKSADTITYDNDGKIIPPSKRFTDQSDIRYSKQIEVDEFDEAGYDVINTTGKKRYADLKREVMTWDTDRHMNEVRCITIGSGFYVYKMLDTPTMDILVYKPQTATTRREFNEIRKITHERKNAGPVSASAQLGYIGREVRGDSQLSGVESGQHKRNASGTGRSLRGEGNGNRGRSAENVRNDQLQKGLNADSRKSKSIDDTGRTSLLRDDKRLDEMNITLRQVFDSQELETGHHTSQTQVQRVARQLKKSTGSKMDTPRLMVQLKGLFDYIGNNDDVTFSSVMDQAKEIAHELLDSTPEHTVRDEYAQEVLDTLRGMAITLSDEQKAETAYHHDRYGNDLLFLYFASKSTATPKAFCFLLLFV